MDCETLFGKQEELYLWPLAYDSLHRVGLGHRLLAMKSGRSRTGTSRETRGHCLESLKKRLEKRT